MSTGAKAGIGGIGAIIVAVIFTLMQGGSLTDVVGTVVQQGLQGQIEQPTSANREFSQEEQEAATFSKQVLASLEDVWAQQFKANGQTYEYPTLVLFTGSVQSACGQGTAQMGPFYCSGDQKLYLDLSFFATMKQQLGIDISSSASFAYAYVIAHEVGHHIEFLRGTLDRCHRKMSQLDQAAANRLSVKLELLADYYAGCWAHYEQQKYGSLSDRDLADAIDAAQKIGDDYLQRAAGRAANPDSFTHGTSAQRMYWLKKGYETGDWNTTTFEPGELD